MNSIATCFIDLVHLCFPRLCPGCGQGLPTDSQQICIRCLHELPRTEFAPHADNPVEKIFRGRIPVQEAMSLLYFNRTSSMTRRIIHQIKYAGGRGLARFMGNLLAEALLGSGRFSRIDLLVPLPISRKREKIRGYNQSVVICEGMASSLHIPIARNVVVRSRHLQTQTGKSRPDRFENVKASFEIAEAEPARGKHLLLVDDVITTGSTLEACGRVLATIPGVQLSVASLAYTSL